MARKGGFRPSVALVGSECRVAVRRLKSAPGFALLFVLVMSGAMGVLVGVQAIVDTVFRPRLGIARPREVVNIYAAPLNAGNAAWRWQLSRDDYDDLAQDREAFAGVLAWRRVVLPFDGTVGSRAFGEAVSGNYFEVLGVPALVGRMFGAVDDQPGADPSIVISHATWVRTFASSPDVVGREVLLGSVAFRVIGVAPEDFRGLDIPAVQSATAWITLDAAERLAADRAPRSAPSVFVRARLQNGMTVHRATAALEVIATRLDRDRPRTDGSGRDGRRAFVAMAADDLLLHESMHAAARQSVRGVQLALGLVLIVAGVNVGALQMSRLAARTKDAATRRALGATQSQLLLTLSADSFILVAGSVVLAVAAAVIMCSGVSTTLTVAGDVLLPIYPRVELGSLLVLLPVSMVAVLLTGGLPAARVVLAVGRNATAGSGHVTSSWRRWRWLIATQVAVAVVFVALAAMFGRQAMAVLTVSPGFDAQRVVLAGVPGSVTDDQLLETAEVMAGAEASALINGLPVAGGLPLAHVELPDAAGKASPRLLVGTAGVVRALGLQVIAGNSACNNCALVTPRLAAALFDGGAAVGHRVLVTAPSGTTATMPVGAVVREIGDEAAPLAAGTLIAVNAVADTQLPWLVVRLPISDPEALVEHFARLLPAVRLSTPTTGEQILKNATALPKFAATLTLSLAVLATLLCVAGLGGVLGHRVVVRTRELGIRLVLGAKRRTLIGQVISEGMTPVVVGLCVGGFSAVFVVLLVSSMSPQVRELSAWTYGAIAAVFVGTGLLACAGPARHVASVEPSVALRHD